MNMNCCQAWEDAQLPGSDNEMHGRALHYYGGEWHTGNELPPVKFCPWCGVAKTDEAKDRGGSDVERWGAQLLISYLECQLIKFSSWDANRKPAREWPADCLKILAESSAHIKAFQKDYGCFYRNKKVFTAEQVMPLVDMHIEINGTLSGWSEQAMSEACQMEDISYDAMRYAQKIGLLDDKFEPVSDGGAK